ncbi:DNA methylase [Pseudomonas fluorescens]|uniref:DNA methylase n=1 Tax=Pseudomonas fluorescens TaxID=294 RepID=A0AAE2U3Z7_PSEFL|nr:MULTISPECIES: DNA methylase [Pseudomonas fluorescens group]MBD8149931.1 DNA methylase [Pseudomonas fluorescens]MBD8179263.1 DNA methylase [Pseudomonas fluorescens]MBD8269633.1 DNA methylase [Pseudomonas fluorescens]MBD8746488.1 DNA methylase [Pseudomonas fluorescens]MBD8749747.1 DNA methylase [Pseudomonas fluorescens]
MARSISASELGIELKPDDDSSLFKWFIASFLMGKRIQAPIAAQAYKVIVEEEGRDTPRKLQHCTSRELVAMLGRAHYVRYDETTAQRLLDLSAKLNADYSGKITRILQASDDRQAFEKRLAEFDGVGPKTVEIFMRDAATVLF